MYDLDSHLEHQFMLTAFVLSMLAVVATLPVCLSQAHTSLYMQTIDTEVIVCVNEQVSELKMSLLVCCAV